jgi:ubiquinone/menaquinone biosynthesis C-methylase UbiE
VGAWQDTQAVYEAPALNALVACGQWGRVGSLFELGCGTGRLAARLLRNGLPANARYTGVDLSPVMVRRARMRLAPYRPRATVRRTSGNVRFSDAAATYDGVLATYVLDLLAPAAIRRFLAEARRVLAPGGRLFLAGLTHGATPLARLLSWGWKQVHRVAPSIVGGCRPLDSRVYLTEAAWRIQVRRTVTGAGIPSEVIVAAPR